MDLLRREQREIFPQIKPCLRPKHGKRAGTGAVGLGFSVLQNVSQQIEVLNHRGENLTAKYAKDTKRKFRPYFAIRFLSSVLCPAILSAVGAASL
jgi:hypothetical protein